MFVVGLNHRCGKLVLNAPKTEQHAIEASGAITGWVGWHGVVLLLGELDQTSIAEAQSSAI